MGRSDRAPTRSAETSQQKQHGSSANPFWTGLTYPSPAGSLPNTSDSEVRWRSARGCTTEQGGTRGEQTKPDQGGPCLPQMPAPPCFFGSAIKFQPCSTVSPIPGSSCRIAPQLRWGLPVLLVYFTKPCLISPMLAEKLSFAASPFLSWAPYSHPLILAIKISSTCSFNTTG